MKPIHKIIQVVSRQQVSDKSAGNVHKYVTGVSERSLCLGDLKDDMYKIPITLVRRD